MGRGLNADQEPHFLLDPLDKGLEDVEVGLAGVVAGIEVHIRDVGLAARRPDDLHHLVERFLVGVVDAQVQAHRAELAVDLCLLGPVLADLCLVDAEVGALECPDPSHGLAGPGLALVPAGLGGEVNVAQEVVVDVEAVCAARPLQNVRRFLREGFADRDVGPQTGGQEQLEPAAEPRPRAEDLAAAVCFHQARSVEADATAVEVQFEKGRVFPNVRFHQRSLRAEGAIKLRPEQLDTVPTAVSGAICIIRCSES